MPDFEAFVEGSSDLYTVLREDGTVLYQNAAIERVCGYANEELVGEIVFEYVHPDDRERLRSILQNPSQGSTDGSVSYRFRHADGSWVWWELISEPLSQPEMEGYGIISREISERKDRERTLERYRVILDSLDDGVYAIESDGTIVYVNEQYASMKGVAPDDLLGTDIYEWGSDSATERIKTARGEVETGERDSGIVEFEFSTVDGDSVPVEMRFSNVSRPGNEVERVGVIRDVTERKARERALRRKNERLEEFASIVSHDLRNPLNVAQGNLALIREVCDSDYIDEVSSAHTRMEALIDDLLTLAREGEGVAETFTVDLGAAIERSWGNVETKNATLVVDTDRAIAADESRFQQLVENLVRNAVEHGSTCSVSQSQRDAVERSTPNRSEPNASEDTLEHEDPGVTITVGEFEDGIFFEDDGPGIPAEERSRVFESGYTTTSEGTGFGLAIVERIADAHGWSITVTEGADGGARFEISGVEFAD